MAKANDKSPASDSYVPSPGSLANGTGYVDEIAIPPARVVRRFETGNSGDNYKVSRQWVFRKGNLVFTLYDWKSTSLYDPGYWSPEELWQSDRSRLGRTTSTRGRRRSPPDAMWTRL